MRYLYDLIFLLFSIAYLPYLLLKGKAHKDFLQRFGFLPDYLKSHNNDAIWVHAVSVGEVLAVKGLIERLKEAFPEKRILLSTTTKTGNETAKRIFGDSIPRFFFPVDIYGVIQKTLNFINPAFFILVETEIWPNLILELSNRKIPVFVVNGRISDKSFKGYRLIRFFFANSLKKINAFLMQTSQDAERIIALGAPLQRVKVTGNVKYDQPQTTGEKLEGLDKKSLGLEEKEDLLICGSTHPGEEEILLSSYKKLLEDFSSLRLLIAPRHIDRVTNIEELCTKFGFKSLKVSKLKTQRSRNPILLLDTIGDLSRLYSVGTVVFMGGSFIKKGGHNIIEPAVYAKPILFGPYMHNFRDMAEQFLNEKAAIRVSDEEELVDTVSMLLKDRTRAREMGERAASLVERNKGAVDRIVSEVKRYITALN